MGIKPFKKPVVIEPRFARFRYVTTVHDARKVLATEWPEAKGRKYASAIAAVHEALRGERPPSYVRKAILAAAKEAKILAPEEVCNRAQNLVGNSGPG